MKVVGIGVDIVDNIRVKKLIRNRQFISRIYSTKEIKQSKKIKNKANYFSKRFAAKESLSKAIGLGFRKGINFKDIWYSKRINANCIEIHTGRISNLIKNKKSYLNELKKIKKCAKYANSLGIEVHAGHGMDYKTTQILSKIEEIKEFNIGHFIIGEAISIGLKNVIKKIKNSIKR